MELVGPGGIKSTATSATLDSPRNLAATNHCVARWLGYQAEQA